MRVEKAVIKTIEGKEVVIMEQTAIPCFRCGICCTRYQPPLTSEDIGSLASALRISRSQCVAKYAIKVSTKEGYLVKRVAGGCIFLGWDPDGKARCTIHPWRPRACREWTASLAKPECCQGLAKLKPQAQILLPDELFSSAADKQALYSSFKKETSDAGTA